MKEKLEKQELLKLSDKKKAILQFIQEAFCIVGSVKIVHKTKCYNHYIECNDKKRGVIFISFQGEQNDRET